MSEQVEVGNENRRVAQPGTRRFDEV